MRAVLALAITFILALPAVAQVACGGAFLEAPRSHFETLTKQWSVSESQILKAAQSDILGDRNISVLAKDSIVEFFNVFQMNKDYRREISIEIQRRDYKAALEKMGVQVKVDPMFALRKNAHYFRLMFSLGANAGLNYLSYRYLGTAGFLVSAPQFKFFRPDKIPDEVLMELLTKPEGGPLTKAYVNARVRHGADVVIKNLNNFVFVGILSWLAVFHHQIVTDPVAYMEKQALTSVSAVTQSAYEINLKTIAGLEVKLQEFERTGQTEKAQKATNLIENIKKQNSEILNPAMGTN
ncbi:hypothetical protein [Bdellovibrio svalbardensis]|uniref:Uncharacterized protein n=1 Tax=Bdellovibrio svalbardensis TaxID=2972972 RepID=A0ABT6DKY6_9BACT|nr:hypothetical protein [Bdellovibrio svalbardensis]MDG0817311.1 hypothetical protein [Bdellovibrio svalbardensis]